MTIWVVVWVVLMLLWLVFDLYPQPAPGGPPRNIPGTLIPWACVLILGLVMFGAVGNGRVVVAN